MSPDDPRHGTRNGYSNLHCRCRPCRDAWAADCKARQARRHLEPGDPRHGAATSYTNYGCRCDECRESWNAYKRDLYQRKVGRT